MHPSGARSTYMCLFNEKRILHWDRTVILPIVQILGIENCASGERSSGYDKRIIIRYLVPTTEFECQIDVRNSDDRNVVTLPNLHPSYGFRAAEGRCPTWVGDGAIKLSENLRGKTDLIAFQ